MSGGARRPRPAVTANHPATAAAGAEVLADGGNAVDAAIAATFASCVAESIMTGLGGGGHAMVVEPGGLTTALDCFVALPGLEGPGRPEGAADEPPMVEVPIRFEDVVVPYQVGVASIGIPGVVAGCGALWERYGRLPWGRLLAPARRLARDGAALPPTHATVLAMVAPALVRHEGAALYMRDGGLLGAGEALRQPGLDDALAAIAEEGAGCFGHGTLAEALLAAVAGRGGAISRTDLEAYAPVWSRPASVPRGSVTVLARPDRSGLLPSVARTPHLGTLDPGSRAVALAHALAPASVRRTGTTHLNTIDDSGLACAFTHSLGMGSGVWLPGFDLHLNSMLGEMDLFDVTQGPGERLGSNMVPVAVTDAEGLVLVAGSAGGARIRSALLQVVTGIVDEGLDARTAVERARLHVDATEVHVEPDTPDAAIAALEEAGYAVRRWASRHHFFGGAGVVGRAGAAGDSRRDGVAIEL